LVIPVAQDLPDDQLTYLARWALACQAQHVSYELTWGDQENHYFKIDMNAFFRQCPSCFSFSYGNGKEYDTFYLSESILPPENDERLPDMAQSLKSQFIENAALWADVIQLFNETQKS
jgi:hypothetical protein